MKISIGNFEYYQEGDKWLYKSKDYKPKKPKIVEKIAEPVETELLTEIENKLKIDYNQVLVNTTKEILIFLNTLEDV